MLIMTIVASLFIGSIIAMSIKDGYKSDTIVSITIVPTALVIAILIMGWLP